MASVRAAKAAAIDVLTFSPVAQPGVTGAALMAESALTGASARPGGTTRRPAPGPMLAEDRL
jgi:hypothetical protein